MLRHVSIALLIAFGCASAPAQNGLRMSGLGQPSGSFLQRPTGFPSPSGRRSLIGLSGVPFHDARRHGLGRNSFFYGGWPYFPPDYYYDDSYLPQAALEPAPPVQTPVAATRLEPVPSAVLLELQGNQWVKVSAFATATPAKSASEAVRELPPAVIVYRDGHSEELTSYSIMGTTLYAKADYLATGAWTRKVQLADLDLPATVKQNQQRGLKFELPSGPNEVVLRP
ncbi:MAG TPA: hypothetical protein VL156_11395 [Terriglobales bacterium]|jgi:hypothetical protein|nr:hypothetical protein [Terriglobales bacterium]